MGKKIVVPRVTHDSVVNDVDLLYIQQVIVLCTSANIQNISGINSDRNITKEKIFHKKNICVKMKGILICIHINA